MDVAVPEERAAAVRMRHRNLSGRTGCGVCGVAEIDQVLRPLPAVLSGPTIAPAAIDRAMRGLPGMQRLNGMTGAVHAAGFADRDGRLILVREDVGRHNALDKLIGALARRADGAPDPGTGLIVVSSRASFEMVQKTAAAGVGILAAVSAPTALAQRLAERLNIALLGFMRDNDTTLYAHTERISA
jgi:FdhD protein